MFDTQAYKELFEPQEETKHPWSRGMTEDQVRIPARLRLITIYDASEQRVANPS
jgi:hypothetical protein